MFGDIIRQINWLDIFIIILLLKVCITSMKGGLTTELFKFLGVVCAIYLSLHYYTVLSGLIRRQPSFDQESLPVDFFDFFSLLALAILGYLIFVVIRVIFNRFIKMDAEPNLNKRGGLVLGIARAFLAASLIVFMLVASNIGYLARCVDTSYLSRRLFNVAPATYSWLWNTLTSKLISGEEFNKAVSEAQDSFAR